MADLLQVDGLWAGYGNATVLEDVSFTLEAGASLALLGRNGMGKTTLLATLMGATRQLRGHIRLDRQDLNTVPSHRRAHAGLGWVPQERDIFPSLSVEENLTVVARPGPWDLQKIYATFPRLRERRTNMGNQLSGGEQQMLALARALVVNPRLLLLDEPLEGLAPLIVQELVAIIARMMLDGSMAVILVEQHAHQILPITRDALVLERGRVVHHGPSDVLAADPDLLDRWLGVAAH
jgi:branched-chain amino acid transport system ATP-binding protein